MSNKKNGLTRRNFVQTAALTAAAASAFPRFTWGAENDKVIKIALIGCGERGHGAMTEAMAADKNVKVVALADINPDQVKNVRKDYNSKTNTEIPQSNCFVGIDAYKKALETDANYVILATPPYYRPLHVTAAIAADKNVFMEKPVAVDPVGIRKVLAAGEEAKKKKLMVGAGTQRRHNNGYIETIKLIKKGAIGDIVAGQCYWNMGSLGSKQREEGWDDFTWMHRDWVNWCWLSGDHIVEQHIHNIDVINWAIGSHPIKAVSFGSRQRRATGDQYDNFSTDFTYPGPNKDFPEIHVHSMCRQINGCPGRMAERVVGTKGISDCNGWISAGVKVEYEKNNQNVQEHKDLIDAIRSGKELNEAQNVAESTLSAIMARTAAYTGQDVTWDEIMKADWELKMPEYKLTEENWLKHVPVPGKAS